MAYKKHTYGQDAFTLPTVVVAGTIMMALLAVALQLVSVTSQSLRNQLYNQMAMEAVESGVVHANECLKGNGYVPQWTAARPLMPNTSCQGYVDASLSRYVVDSANVRSSYRVDFPSGSDGVQRVNVTGEVELLRSGTTDVWRSYSRNGSANMGAAVSFNTVVFGYDSSLGSFFSVMYPDGRVMTTGYNGQGQHGKLSYAHSTTPEAFQLPGTEVATGVYTSFLSSGSRIFVSTDHGNLYGAGLNSSGQIGDGTTLSRTAPARFGLPFGVSPRAVSLLQDTTFVAGSDNNVYASGACSLGVLGSSYTVSGCSNVMSPVRVALPTPNTSNPNTLPEDIVSDGLSAFVRMQGGAVYGWGANSYGQLGSGNTADRSSPIRIGTFGNTGQPSIVQLAFDGETLYMLDDNGEVWVTGGNRWGQLAGAPSQIKNWGSNGSDGLCIHTGTASAAVGTRVRATSCTDSSAQRIEFMPILDGAPGFRGLLRATASGLCIDNQSNGTANGNPIILSNCSEGIYSQLWRYADGNGRGLHHPSTGKCLDKASDNNLQLWQCNGTAAQFWLLQDVNRPVKVPLPAGHRVKKISTDQVSVMLLMTNGTVWTAGANDYGQLGTGSNQRDLNPALRKFIIPSAAKDIYTTKFNDNANSFAVLTDGRVYGSGRNHFGQLGIGSASPSINLFTPVRMSLPASVRANTVQTGLGTTVVLTDSGEIYTVGNNSHGQLGDGTTNPSYLPEARKYVNVLPLVIF